jgi:RNA polymerase sigma-70 factor, ECF subfamily
VTASTSSRDRVADLAAALECEHTALTGYCYRMLGSAFEADDAVQETMLRAWRGLDRYEGRAPLRSWLYRIATNVCIDALNGRRRRALPMDMGPSSPGDRDVSAPPRETPWILPVPDGRVIDADADPSVQAAARDSIRLAFVAALQHLRPRPRAVLILRDVIGWSAEEVADLLDTTATAVHSALQRARRTLTAHGPPRPDGAAPLGDTDQLLLRRYVDAFVRYDIETLVALLHEDATMSMPPYPEWMRGRPAIERWWRGHGSGCFSGRVVPTSANGTPAVALYRRVDPATFEARTIQLIEVSDGLITGIHSFVDPRLFPLFDLPTRIIEQHAVQPDERDQVA